MISRRNLLAGILASGIAPAGFSSGIGRVLMPVRPLADRTLFTFGVDVLLDLPAVPFSGIRRVWSNEQLIWIDEEPSSAISFPPPKDWSEILRLP
jgi:hypothetical protein